MFSSHFIGVIRLLFLPRVDVEAPSDENFVNLGEMIERPVYPELAFRIREHPLREAAMVEHILDIDVCQRVASAHGVILISRFLSIPFRSTYAWFPTLLKWHDILVYRTESRF